jgi:hypothetical protein
MEPESVAPSYQGTFSCIADPLSEGWRQYNYLNRQARVNTGINSTERYGLPKETSDFSATAVESKNRVHIEGYGHSRLTLWIHNRMPTDTV